MQIAAPNPAALHAVLSGFRGTVHRAKTLTYPDPCDATGSALYGGRYNPRGLFSVLNCSLNPWIAALEVLDHSPDGGEDLTIAEFDVSLDRALDWRYDEALATVTVPAVPPGDLGRFSRQTIEIARGARGGRSAWDFALRVSPIGEATETMPRPDSADH